MYKFHKAAMDALTVWIKLAFPEWNFKFDDKVWLLDKEQLTEYRGTVQTNNPLPREARTIIPDKINVIRDKDTFKVNICNNFIQSAELVKLAEAIAAESEKFMVVKMWRALNVHLNCNNYIVESDELDIIQTEKMVNFNFVVTQFSDKRFELEKFFTQKFFFLKASTEVKSEYSYKFTLSIPNYQTTLSSFWIYLQARLLEHKQWPLRAPKQKTKSKQELTIKEQNSFLNIVRYYTYNFNKLLSRPSIKGPSFRVNSKGQLVIKCLIESDNPEEVLQNFDFNGPYAKKHKPNISWVIKRRANINTVLCTSNVTLTELCNWARR